MKINLGLNLVNTKNINPIEHIAIAKPNINCFVKLSEILSNK